MTLFTDNVAYTDKIDEIKGSPEEGLGSDGMSATVQLLVPWVDRLAILDDIVRLRRSYPYANLSGASAVSGGSKPFGKSVDDEQGLIYDSAMLTINYGQRDGQSTTGGGVVFTESLQPSAEFITLDHTNFEWTDNSALTPAEAPGRLQTGFDYVQKRFNVPSIPAAILSEIGNVNSGAKLSVVLGLTFPVETLLYALPSLERSLEIDGTGAWDITTTFSYRGSGWNRFWRASSQSYEQIQIKNSGPAYNNFPLSGTLPLL